MEEMRIKGKLAAINQQRFIEAINSIGATKQYAYKHTPGRISPAGAKGKIKFADCISYKNKVRT